MQADNDVLGMDAIAFGLLREACLTLAQLLVIQDPERGPGLLEELGRGLDDAVAKAEGRRPHGGFAPGALDAARGRVGDVLRDAVRQARRRHAEEGRAPPATP